MAKSTAEPKGSDSANTLTAKKANKYANTKADEYVEAKDNDIVLWAVF